MATWISAFKKYFILVGLFANFGFIVVCGLLMYKINTLDLSLPLFSEKIRNNLSIKKPNLLSVVSPLLDGMSYFEEKNYYFRSFDITQWHGVGAKKHAKFDVNNTITVFNEGELLTALKNVIAGQSIVISPGDYVIDQFSIHLAKAGTQNNPIRVIANQLGTVKIYIRGEGFVVNRPYWQFQNLHLIGNCKKHSRCEHAFHVVGQGKHTTIENNILQDFNAMIKVNGVGNNYPDYGSVVQNTIFNTSPRKTKNPVTPIDLMHANNWRVANNFIFDIQKSAGDEVSYAAFFKGGSQNGIFEQNLVICAANLADQYTSIGLSLGGGGSLKAHRRDKNPAEHVNGIIRNNIVMHCSNDVGLYLNRASNSQVHHNILYNTLGIDVRFEESSATIDENIISGRIKKREKGKFTQRNNLIVKQNFFTGKDNMSDYFIAPDIGDFSWRDTFLVNDYKELTPSLFYDFCGNRAQNGYVGAFSGKQFCLDQLNLKSVDNKESP
ncbi:hypothetical protein [Colwellia sp. 12G3]|uniref:hypothetical protein n=1 Tax=Colwellia sp. 12G3 TaxID=2058299 RepID=UPI000C344032|nr:hypothetical protein [Colwellia sp. 12G3]PKI15783.1 hypothetical protein CXF71_12285 [Colwellia sp. 12G3]